MDKIREWFFPIGLIVAWVLASSYTVASLVEAHGTAANAIQAMNQQPARAPELMAIADRQQSSR